MATQIKPGDRPKEKPVDDFAAVPAPLAIRLEAFVGPMDLLLELIKKHEVDIFDIPIALITEEYLEAIEQMEALDLQVGGEWLEMAATLIFIKSRMLLPVQESVDEEDGPDPRADLVRRLVEYQRYQLFAQKLDGLAKLDHDVFLHPVDPAEFSHEGPLPLREVGISALIDAVRRLAAKQGSDAGWVVEMTREKITLRSVMIDVAELLHTRPRVCFEELFIASADTPARDFSRYRVVTVFLALLEMTKRKIVKLMQTRLDGDHLYIERAVINIVEVSQTLDLPEPAAG